jgi:hypothetical protein
MWSQHAPILYSVLCGYAVSGILEDKIQPPSDIPMEPQDDQDPGSNDEQDGHGSNRKKFEQKKIVGREHSQAYDC